MSDTLILGPRALRPRGLRLRLGPHGIVGDDSVAFGSARRFWRFEARARQHAGLLENRVSDRTDVRVDPAQIGDQIEMQRRRFDAVDGVAREAAQMRVGVRTLKVTE